MRLLDVELCERRCLMSVLTVTSATDSAPGSLRATISKAVATDVIGFAPKLRGATLALTMGELVINKSLTIQGSGQTIDAGGNSRVLEVDGPNANVNLSALTITGGVAEEITVPGLAFAGGGIAVADANLTLRNCTITGNRAQGKPGGNLDAAIAAEGGGLFALQSQVNLINTSITGNQSLGGVDSLTEQAGAAGGGGMVLVASQAQMSGGSVNRNLAKGGDAVNPISRFPSSDGGSGDGGGALLLSANLSLSHVAISNNEALGGLGLDGRLAIGMVGTPGPGIGGTAAGGAIFLEGSGTGSAASTLSMTNVSLNHNVAQGGQAGMAKDNTQPAVPGGLAVGGAIEQNQGATLVLNFVLFQGNQALGGPAALNIPQGEADTSSGGEAFGGAVDSEFFIRISGSNVTMRNNLAQGAPGGDSAPKSGTEAGVGGPAQGGAWNLRDTGGLKPSPPLPVTLTNSTFYNNRALAGPGGSGPQPTGGLGSGGYATGGGMQTSGIFNLQLTGTRWLNNVAIAQQGEIAFGGALGMSFGSRTSKTLIANSLFNGNLARGGNDPQAVRLRDASGGAILNDCPNTTILNTRFAFNTAQGGNATGIGVPGNAGGGAIDSSGNNTESLALSDDDLVGNRALGGLVVAGPNSNATNSGIAHGGAVLLEDGSLTVSGTEFSTNRARSAALGSIHNASGGALYVNAGTTAKLSDNVMQGNLAQAFGGNSAHGGAVTNFSNAFSDVGSTFTGNQAVVRNGGTASGGGLYLANNSSLSQSKITGNGALARGRGQGFGGGIAFANNPKVGLQNVIVRNNRASTAGPNLYGSHQNP
jgi:hypothetical protein